MPSANTIELYDLSPQRMVGLPVRASWVTCVQNWKVIESDTQLFSFKKQPVNSYAIRNNSTLCIPYIRVVLWGGVGFCFIQRYDEQAALDGLQDGLIVWINAY